MCRGVSMADGSSHGAVPSCDHCKQVTFNLSQFSSSYSGKGTRLGSERHRKLLEEAWGCTHKQKPQLLPRLVKRGCGFAMVSRATRKEWRDAGEPSLQSVSF